MNKICVYAIAKNESKNVERWVASMRPADHIVVLDTGSEDNTVELLTSLGVEVHQKQYEHFRFDVARNDSLKLVPDEYNIRVCTDIDEAWEQDNWADLLREYWDEENPRVCYNYVWSHAENQQNGLEFHINKIHGKDPYLVWGGAVHEYLMDSRTGDRNFSKFVDMTKILTLHHYCDINKDRMFYLNLIEERLKESPDDFQTWFLLGNEQMVKGRIEDAAETYEKITKKFTKNPNLWELSSVYYHLGKCYCELNRGVEAMVAFSSGIAVNKEYRDNYFGLGLIFLENEMTDAAIGILEEGLKTSKQIYGWMDDPTTWTFALYDLLGLAYCKKQNYAKALGYAIKALSYDNKNELLQQRYNYYLTLV